MKSFRNVYLFFFDLDSFSFKILSAAAWPHPGDKIDVSLPAQIEDVLPEIEEFYKKKHSGRKLTWHHTVSNGQVRILTKTKPFMMFFFS
jgi:cullin-5